MAFARLSRCILLFATLLVILSFSPAAAQETGKELIEETCSDTPYPDLCVSTFLSDPRSLKVFYKDLGKIMTELLLAEATSTRSFIKQRLEQNRDLKIKTVLEKCQKNYTSLINGIESVMRFFRDYTFDPVVGAMDSAQKEVRACRDVLKKGGLHKSPVDEKNAFMSKLAGIAFVIIIDMAV